MDHHHLLGIEAKKIRYEPLEDLVTAAKIGVTHTPKNYYHPLISTLLYRLCVMCMTIICGGTNFRQWQKGVDFTNLAKGEKGAEKLVMHF